MAPEPPNMDTHWLLTFAWLRCGFVRAVTLALRIREDGLMMGGPPCGPWVYMNSGTHQRSLQNVWGNLSSSYVNRANTLPG